MYRGGSKLDGTFQKGFKIYIVQVPFSVAIVPPSVGKCRGGIDDGKPYNQAFINDFHTSIIRNGGVVIGRPGTASGDNTRT